MSQDRTKYQLVIIFQTKMKLLPSPSLNLDITKDYLHNISTDGLFNSFTFYEADSDPSLFIVTGLWFLSIIVIVLVICTYPKMCQAERDVQARPQGRRSVCEQVLADNNPHAPSLLQ